MKPTQFFNSNLENFSPEDTCLVEKQLVNQQNIEGILLCVNEFLDRHTVTEQTKIVFCAVDEAVSAPTLCVVIAAVLHIKNKYHQLSSNNFYFLCSGWPCTYTVKEYKKLAKLMAANNYPSLLLKGYVDTANINNKDYVPDLIPKKKEKTFLCYNGAGRVWRTDFVAGIVLLGLRDHCLLSYNDFEQAGVVCKSRKDELIKIAKNLEPVYLDYHTDTYNKINQSHIDATYMSVVTETQYCGLETQLNSDHTVLAPSTTGPFPTEKTFRTILSGHPFILVSAPFSLAALKERGFKSFSPHINESYDAIEDDEQRMYAIWNEMTRLSTLSDEEWISIQHSLTDTLIHNRQVLIEFYNKEHIYTEDELLQDTEFNAILKAKGY